ncbi:Diguanylate cyclase VdcA [bacterium HR40]|nr:Diguanylate cyclase VdcA [bacterium HR40]
MGECRGPHGKARAIAVQVVKSLRRHGLPPTPEYYELFFLYHEGSHPALARDIESRLAAGESLDEATCRTLYERHVARAGLEQAIERAGEQLAELGSRLDDEVAEAEVGFRQSAERIERLVARAADSEEPRELKDLLARALAETRAVVEAALQLEHRLHVTRAELSAVTEAFISARREAETDPLTGLPNRRRFERAVAHAVERVRRGGPAPILLLADIDHFKDFNDRHGHVTGDLVLKAVAQLLRRNVDERDLVSRWGGEEFAILLQPRGLAQGEAVAERLRRTVGSRRIRQRTTGRDLGTVTLSIGVGEASPYDTPEEWIERVDRALYRAKRRGRDRVEVAEPPARSVSPAEIAFTPGDDDAPAAATVAPRLPAAEERP